MRINGRIKTAPIGGVTPKKRLFYCIQRREKDKKREVPFEHYFKKARLKSSRANRGSQAKRLTRAARKKRGGGTSIWPVAVPALLLRVLLFDAGDRLFKLVEIDRVDRVLFVHPPPQVDSLAALGAERKRGLRIVGRKNLIADWTAHLNYFPALEFDSLLAFSVLAGAFASVFGSGFVSELGAESEDPLVGSTLAGVAFECL